MHRHLVLSCRRVQQIQPDAAILVVYEHRLTVVATLDEMVRIARHREARLTGQRVPLKGTQFYSDPHYLIALWRVLKAQWRRMIFKMAGMAAVRCVWLMASIMRQCSLLDDCEYAQRYEQ
jgi:hypothetical protein